MANNVTTSGFTEFAAKLRSISSELGESALRSAAVAGGTLMRDDAIARAPEETGRLKRALYLKFIDEKSSDTSAVYYVGIRRGKAAAAQDDDAYYGRMVEFGHWYIPPKPKGVRWATHRKQWVGKKWVPAYPFMRPAFDTRRLEVIQAMRERLQERLLEVLHG